MPRVRGPLWLHTLAPAETPLANVVSVGTAVAFGYFVALVAFRADSFVTVSDGPQADTVADRRERYTRA